MDEGYVKFRQEWIAGPPPTGLDELRHWRDTLHACGWIGYDEQLGVSYGNISLRGTAGQFIISGTNTGRPAHCDDASFTRVEAFDIGGNWLASRGPVPASSESLTHAAVYLARADVGAVIHIHDRALWQRWLDRLPTTGRDLAYGTPEMALAVQAACAGLALPTVIVMGGHTDGLLALGASVAAAAAALQACAAGGVSHSVG
ncbi:MAG: hypothetical protein OHK0039_30010 [Bacteroidia bacterium]